MVGIKSIPMDLLCEYFPEKEICQNLPSGNHETLIQVKISGQRLNMGIPEGLPALGPELKDIPLSELVNPEKPRKTQFNIESDSGVTLFTINGREFAADTIHERLGLGQAEQWEITSKLSHHPYHIHINPFQVVKIGDETVDPPVWKDVVMVNMTHKANIRTRYTRFWGDFVLHCHILHHEDEGMMQRIRIRRPRLQNP